MASWRAEIVKRGFVAALKAQRRFGGDIDLDGPEEDVQKVALKMREQFEALASHAPVPRWADHEPLEGSPVPGEMVRSDRTDQDNVVLHLHGGGYVMCSPTTHRGMATTIARVARARVCMPDYRLAPEHPFPAALDDALATYRWLLAEGVDPSRLAVSGDSAGGGLAVSMMVALRDAGDPLPACYVGLSPWTDLAGTGASMTERDERDPWLSAKHVPSAARAYAGKAGLDDPGVSPLYADLAGLPPMLVHAGTEEILYDDGRRLVERARAAGVEASFGEFEGMWHVFQAFPGIPESRRAWREIGAFMRRNLAPGPHVPGDLPEKDPLTDASASEADVSGTDWADEVASAQAS